MSEKQSGSDEWADRTKVRDLFVHFVPELSEEVREEEDTNRSMRTRAVATNRGLGIVDGWFESVPPTLEPMTVITMFVRGFLEPEIDGDRRDDALKRAGEFIGEILEIDGARDAIDLEIVAYFEEVPGSWSAFEPYATPKFREYVKVFVFP